MGSVLEELVFDDQNGEILMGRDRFMLIRPETLAALARAAGEEAGRIFSQAGQEGGRIAAGRISDRHEGDPAAVVRALLEMGGAIGWARMNLTAWDKEAKSLQVEARSRTLDWPGGAGWDLLGGILSGLGEVIFQAPVDVDRSFLKGDDQAVEGVRYSVRVT